MLLDGLETLRAAASVGQQASCAALSQHILRREIVKTRQEYGSQAGFNGQ